jgi:hypothetical protein
MTTSIRRGGCSSCWVSECDDDGAVSNGCTAIIASPYNNIQHSRVRSNRRGAVVRHNLLLLHLRRLHHPRVCVPPHSCRAVRGSHPQSAPCAAAAARDLAVRIMRTLLLRAAAVAPLPAGDARRAFLFPLFPHPYHASSPACSSSSSASSSSDPHTPQVPPYTSRRTARLTPSLVSAGCEPGHAAAALLPEPVRPLPAARFGVQDLDCEQAGIVCALAAGCWIMSRCFTNR